MPMIPRRTKIVATIGPASSSPEALRQLMQVFDGARLNFSHGTHDEHAERARAIRAAQDELGRPVALIADLQGPKLRVGDLAQPVELERGQECVLAGEDGAQDGDLPIAPAVLGSVLQPGFDVLIDDCREVLSHADSDRVPRAAGVTQYPPAGLGEPASVHRRDDVEAAFEQSNLRIRLT